MHSVPIPQVSNAWPSACIQAMTKHVRKYIIASAPALSHRLQKQILLARSSPSFKLPHTVLITSRAVHMIERETLGHERRYWRWPVGTGIAREDCRYLRIGHEAGRLATTFGAKILAATSFLSRSDVLLLALLSAPAMCRILDATTLAHLQDTAVVVNVVRGDAIDTDAPVAVLGTGRLRWVALNRVEHEPLPIWHSLHRRSNVVLTPHMIGRTVSYMERALDIFTEILEKIASGRDLLNML